MNFLAVIGIYVAAAAGTLALGLLARWYDRKLTAMVQYRKGPPWYQPVADVLKLLGVNLEADKAVYLEKPMAISSWFAVPRNLARKSGKNMA